MLEYFLTIEIVSIRKKESKSGEKASQKYFIFT